MTEIPKKHIIDVIPITPLPFSRQSFFSYTFDRPLPCGTLVSIPFFRRTIQGIVLNSRDDFEHVGNFVLKKIHAVEEEHMLTRHQLKLAEFLSNYYIAPIGKVLKSFVPQRVTARSKPQELQAKKSGKIIRLTSPQQEAINAIIKSTQKSPAKFLLFGPASSGKTEIYIESIRSLPNTKQALILVPELTLTPQAIDRYGQHFPSEQIVLIHSNLSKGQYYQNWQKIKSGEAHVIIGTRMAVFAPFKDLGLIVIDEEHDISFKQWDMAPRYDARKAAEFLSDSFGAPLIFGTATPRIETFYRCQQNQLSLLTLPPLKKDSKGNPSLPTIEVVDMRKERWTDYSGKTKPNYSCISRKLQGEINFALSNKSQCILFINHQGMSTFSICEDCKTVLKCPDCDRALTYDDSIGEYICIHCKYKSSAFPKCSQCGSMKFKNIGIGTQLVQREIKKLFPAAKIARLDTAALKKSGVQEETYRQLENKEIDILIGTQMITKGWDFPNVTLVGIIDSDSLFSFPDFLTDEKAFQHIMQVSGRTGRLQSRWNGIVILQTYNPSNEVINAAKDRDFKRFYERQIIQREDLRYPPFGKLIKIQFQHEDKNKAQTEINAFHQSILKIIEDTSGISITDPHFPFVPKIRSRYRIQLLIKLRSGIEIPQPMRNAIGKLKKGWIIDVDPINII